MCYTCGWDGANQGRIQERHPNGRGTIYTCPMCNSATIRRMSSARKVVKSPERQAHDAARYQVTRAVLQGEMPSARSCKCANCNNKADDYHHDDYSKPLDVIPLCRDCHALRHRQLVNAVSE